MKHCPNCGAPISHYYNYKCEYCGTFLKNTDEDIKKFENCYISNINVDIQDDFIHHGKILSVYGNLVPKCNYYEESFNNMVVLSSDMMKKVGYRILIPYKLIYNNDFRKIEEYIYHSIPEDFDDAIPKILDKLWQVRR